MMTRCHWSDLPTEMCGHCTGATPLPVESTPAEPINAPAVRIWPEVEPAKGSETAQNRSGRPRTPSAGVSSTAVIRGRQGGQNECVCGKPTRDNAVICDDDTETMRRALGDVAAVGEELEVSITRQRAAAITGSAPSAERGLPWHETAATAQRHLHGLLVSWVRLCSEEGVGAGPEVLPKDTLTGLSGWLLHRVDGLARHDAAADALDEITDAVAECERIIFWKRKNRIYLGTCEQRVEDEDGVTLLDSCPGEVYADEGMQVGHCDDCGQGVTVVVRQSDLNRRLDDRLCTAAELARLAVILGLDAKRDTVRRKIHYWHRHKRIVQRGADSEGTPMFRYGEVRAMLYAEFVSDTA